MGLPEPMARFYAMITNIDDNLKMLRDEMQTLGIEDNTILIFMTDNGSALAAQTAGEPLSLLGEEVIKKYELEETSLNYGMREGKSSIYEGGHRVPLYIRWPGGGIDQPRDINQLSAHYDIFPTLLELANIQSSFLSNIDGISLANVMTDVETSPVDRHIVVTQQRVDIPHPDRPYSVLNNEWRYTYIPIGTKSGTSIPELYHIETDPSQKNNVINEYPEIVGAMKKEYEKWWEHSNPDTTPLRFVVGHDAQNPTRLAASDWATPFAGGLSAREGSPKVEDTPFGRDKWWVGYETDYDSYPWPIEVSAPAKYDITLFLHDSPALKPIGQKYAVLELDDGIVIQDVEPQATSITFEKELQTGNNNIRAWFTDDPNGEWIMGSSTPAFYAYFRRK